MAGAGEPPHKRPNEAEYAYMEDVARRLNEALAAPVFCGVMESDGRLRFAAASPAALRLPAPFLPAEYAQISSALSGGPPVSLDAEVAALFGADEAALFPWSDAEGLVGACVVAGTRAEDLPADMIEYAGRHMAETLRKVRQRGQLKARIAELEQTATAFRALVECTSDAVKVYDLDGRVRIWNAACETLYGYKAREVLNHVLPHVPPERRARAIHDFRRVASRGVTAEGELIGTRKDGSRFGASVTRVPLADADGLPVGVLTVVRRLDTDTRLEQMQGDFLSLVSQELKNPLTAILGYTQLLSRPEIREDVAKRTRTVRALESRAQQMSAVIDDLLLASRVDRGELRLHREPTDLASLVTETVAHFEQFQPKHRFVIDADTRMPEADIDARRIGQALANLLSNAVKYSPGSGEIRVKVVRSGEHGVVSVTDCGEGIPMEDLERVFDRFYKAVGTKGDPGAGLGLYLVRTIVEAHGGNVTVASKPKKGSVFTMRLPLVVS